jgi:hypothetical protein
LAQGTLAPTLGACGRTFTTSIPGGAASDIPGPRIEEGDEHCYVTGNMDRLIAFRMQAEVSGQLGRPPWRARNIGLGPRTYTAKPRSNIDVAETRKRVRRRLDKTLAYLATR